MTDCTIDYSAVEHPRECRRTWTIRIAFGLAGLSLIASIFGWHPPEPNQCEPGPARFVIVQVVSPTTLMPCSGAGPKQSPR
jgi:hypothetical protein